MTLSLAMITIDTADALPIARWWAEQTGGSIVAENEGWFVTVSLGDGQPMLAFQKVDDPTPARTASTSTSPPTTARPSPSG